MKTTALQSLAVLLGVALASARGAAFVPGDVFLVPAQAAQSFPLVNITAGGNFSGSPGLAIVDGPQNQMAWSADLSTLYVTRYMTGPVFTSVWAVSATGSVSSFATNAGSTAGIVRTADGRLLTAAGGGGNGKVIDITTGGNFATAPGFATGFGSPRNLVQLANGRILLGDTGRRIVYDITAGGSFTNEEGFAWNVGASDLVQANDGRIFAASGSVFDITAGGDFAAATPFATGQPFIGLTVSGSGRLLASAQNTGKVYDITAGGDFSSATPFATGLTPQGGAALDTVPTPEPSAALLACLGLAGLASRRNRQARALVARELPPLLH